MAASAFCSQTCEALVEPVQQTESETTCTIAMSILPIGSIRPKIVLRRAKLVLRPAHFERVFQLGYSVCLRYPRKHNSDTLPCKSQRICTFGTMPTCKHERTYTTFLCRLGKLSNSMFRVRESPSQFPVPLGKSHVCFMFELTNLHLHVVIVCLIKSCQSIDKVLRGNRFIQTSGSKKISRDDGVERVEPFLAAHSGSCSLCNQ